MRILQNQVHFFPFCFSKFCFMHTHTGRDLNRKQLSLDGVAVVWIAVALQVCVWSPDASSDAKHSLHDFDFKSQRSAGCSQRCPFCSLQSVASVPQRSGWQMFGWLARHNKCVAGCLRWLLLAVLWVLHRQDRTGHFRRLFVKAGNMRTEDRSNVEDLFQFYIVLNSFIFVCALIWCMQQVVSTVVSCLINVCCIYTLRVTVTCQRQF